GYSLDEATVDMLDALDDAGFAVVQKPDADLIRRGREVSEKVTEGPWYHDETTEHGETAHYVRSGGVDGEHLAVLTGNYAGARRDAKFITASRTLVTDLLDALESIND